MEVLGGSKDEGLVLRNTLDLVCPLASNLDGSLDGLSTGAHGQTHVVAENLLDLLGPLGEDIVVESARAEGEAAGLLSQGLDKLRVAVTLVDGAVGGEEVEVLVSLGVPDVHALSLGKDNGERVVVVGGELLLDSHGALGGRGVESGRGGDIAGRGGICVRGHCDGFIEEGYCGV